MTAAFNLSQLANNVNTLGQLDGATGLYNTASLSFSAGTVMLFAQTTAPTGWTKSTTHNDKALRIVSGTAGTGGSSAFSAVFTSGLSASATTLSTAQMPSHSHSINLASAAGESYQAAVGNNSFGGSTGAAGGNGSHTHSLPSFAVSYVDVILASKN